MLNQFRESIANAIYPEQLNERRRLSRAINVDVLTGLANRRAFELALPTAEQDPGTFVVVFDANNFGRLNKIAGHAFGDSVLRQFAGVIIDAARELGSAERAFRIGGDEFVVLIDRDLAVTLRDRIEAAFEHVGPDGVSLTGTVGSTFADADSQLQARKQQRKGTNDNQ